MKKIKIGIVGASGYTGAVLVRLLLDHPNVDISYLGSNTYEGKEINTLYPIFEGITNLKFQKINSNIITKNCDLIFLATPNGFAKDFIKTLFKINNKIKVIDLSADFRLDKNFKIGAKTYSVTYGLPELNRKEIKTSDIIANPGCYPTSILLGLAPAIKNGLIDIETIIADSKSGVSGAGKTPKQELHFVEANDGFSPYKLAGEHRHIPEIEKQIKDITSTKKDFHIIFSPHLLPVNRGILSTIYADLNKNISQNQIQKAYKDFYKNEYFIKIFTSEKYPNIKDVRYSNFCFIKPMIDTRTNKLIVVSCIDNMVKGASGQAIQNMNILFNVSENTGLKSLGHLP